MEFSSASIGADAVLQLNFRVAVPGLSNFCLRLFISNDPKIGLSDCPRAQVLIKRVYNKRKTRNRTSYDPYGRSVQKRDYV